MKFDIKLLVRYYVRRNKAYEALGTVDRAILQCAEFPTALVDLQNARAVLRREISEMDSHFSGKRGKERTELCRFLVDKLGSNSLEGVMEYINELVRENDPEPSDS